MVEPPHSRGLEKKPSGEASVPQSILREIRFGTAGFPLLFLMEHLVLERELKAPAVPAQARGFPLSSSLLPTGRRTLSACCFPNNPNNAVRGSGEERSWGQCYPVQAPLGVGLPQDLSDNPTPPYNSLRFFLTSKKPA